MHKFRSGAVRENDLARPLLLARETQVVKPVAVAVFEPCRLLLELPQAFVEVRGEDVSLAHGLIHRGLARSLVLLVARFRGRWWTSAQKARLDRANQRLG